MSEETKDYIEHYDNKYKYLVERRPWHIYQHPDVGIEYALAFYKIEKRTAIRVKELIVPNDFSADYEVCYVVENFRRKIGEELEQELKKTTPEVLRKIDAYKKAGYRFKRVGEK